MSQKVQSPIIPNHMCLALRKGSSCTYILWLEENGETLSNDCSLSVNRGQCILHKGGIEGPMWSAYGLLACLVNKPLITAICCYFILIKHYKHNSLVCACFMLNSSWQSLYCGALVLKVWTVTHIAFHVPWSLVNLVLFNYYCSTVSLYIQCKKIKFCLILVIWQCCNWDLTSKIW